MTRMAVPRAEPHLPGVRIDLYSDAKSPPSAAMRAAMAQAEVGDEQAGEDPTTSELARRVAALLGMTHGVFLPSGTMCNIVAVLAHTRPGDEIVCDRHAHLVGTEAAAAAAIAGVSIQAISSPHGVFGAADVRAAIRPRSRTAPRSALLVVEQATNFTGGAVWSVAELQSVRDEARTAGLRCHVDGARLLNAAIAPGARAAEHVAGGDSAWIDLTKGLGCSVGAVLCGDEDFIERAWQWKYRLGGAMRQSGVLSAAGLYALDHNVQRLADDHRHARLIKGILAASGLFDFDPPEPSINIVRLRLRGAGPASTYAGACLREGVRVRALEDGTIRVTTHLGLDESACREAADVMVRVARTLVSGIAIPA